jgi:tRNA(fMet)-specific endonuclease VapC
VAEDLYDTSYLIDVMKAGQEPSGLTTIFNILEFPKALSLKRLAVVYPTTQDYDEALRLSTRLFFRGTWLPAVDILVAAVCIRLKARLVTKDEHFTLLKAVSEGFRFQVLDQQSV